ncbi:MAG: 2-C-methyl-D-erythritol 4-phosphate cytidylyltransferase [Pseudomonadota bacterium]
MSEKYWAVVPAAGKGTRMGMAMPKQYLELAGKPVIAHTLERLLAHPQMSGAVVALSPDDPIWPTLNIQTPKPIYSTLGGDERYFSVFNALKQLSASGAHEHDWVLVHDAARPCVRASDVTKLIASVAQDDNGGLLGVPVSDTLKRCDDTGKIFDTVDRKALWRALTPQMFKLHLLRLALQNVIQQNLNVTDDAAAMELLGYHPQMVEGHADNIKITRAEDLKLAILYLEMQGDELCA